MTKSFVRKSLELTPKQWESLSHIAEAIGATAPTGSLAGQPSWRTLIKQIAIGNITLSRKEESDD